MTTDHLRSAIFPSSSLIWIPDSFHMRNRSCRWSINSPSRRLVTVKGLVDRRKDAKKRCTADELHYVPVPNTDWHLALWRYLPSAKSPRRNHPLLLLSGVGTNAVGFDLSPQSSFARFMSRQGFDTWTLEFRGAGLSSQKNNMVDSKLGERNQAAGFGVLSLQEILPLTVVDIQNEVNQMLSYDWDFDHHLEEDVPTAMEYIRNHTKPKDNKLFAIGHSMGGILLYALLSKCCFEGRDSGLASVATLAASLDYTSSRSTLKLLLPLAEPAETVNAPAFPMGVLLAAAHPFLAYPPYALSWLTPLISAPEMLTPDLFEKLVRNNFCTIPSKLLLQLTTAFRDGGLRDRSGRVFYKEHIGRSEVPLLAIAGDQDLICPPEAVYETVKLMPERLVKFKVLGEPGGPHYAHYDVVGGLRAAEQVYPLILEFLDRHDA